MKKYCVLYNPLSASSTGKAAVEELKLKHADDVFRTVDVTSVSDYGAFFASLEKDEDLVLCGGDGTLNRFVNDTAGLALPGEIYFTGAGTGNDFLRDLNQNYPGQIFPIGEYLRDLPEVTVNGKTSRFLNGVGYGIDGYCCEEGDRQREAGKEKINYTAIAILGLLGKFKPKNARITVDGVTREERHVWLASAMNGRFYGGGMMAAPEQDRLGQDGKLSLLIFRGKNKIRTLMVFPEIFKGEHLLHPESCELITGDQILVEFDRPCPLQIDGETVKDVLSYSVKSRGALKK